MQHLFEGTTEACYGHLLTHATMGELSVRRIVAAFSGVNLDTTRRWKSVMPVGEPLVRLRFYLEFLGYNVKELAVLKPEIRSATRIVAFQIQSFADLKKALRLESKGGHLLAICRGAEGVSNERLERAGAFTRHHEHKLEEAKRNIPFVELVGSTTPVLEQSRTAPSSESVHTVLIESFAESVKALLPLAKLIASDEFTPVQRARLRSLTGGTSIFHLTNELSRLCGERSRSLKDSH